MAYIQPGSLQIAPPAPDTQSALTFTFTAVEDDMDLLFNLTGFDTTFYVLGKLTASSSWTEYGSWTCNGCFGIAENILRSTSLVFQISIDAVPAGTYDFMVIDKGDYLGKPLPYNISRTATKTNIHVTSNAVISQNQPTLTVSSNVPGAQINVNGMTGWGTVTYPGTVNEPISITILASNYMAYTHTMTMQTGAHEFDAVLTPCSVNTPGCTGYVAPPAPAPTVCASTDLTCLYNQYQQYIPYILVGGAAILLVVSSGSRKQHAHPMDETDYN